MRTLLVSSIVLLTAALALPLRAAVERVPPSVLTVMLDFKGPHSRTALDEMEREAGRILKESGVVIDWRTSRVEPPEGFYGDLAVMAFNGDCQFSSGESRFSKPGALAITHVTDGDVLPFGEVNCTRVVDSVRNALVGEEYDRADQLVGRALGRVVAHELVHMLTKSGEHAKQGVFEPALSGRQLIGPQLNLSQADLDRLRQLRTRNDSGGGPADMPVPSEADAR